MLIKPTALDAPFQQGSQIPSDLNAPPLGYAFGNDLKVGAKVYCYLANIIPTYNKLDVRPMLVSGIWRNGDVIEKLELMYFTSRNMHKRTPGDLLIHEKSLRNAFRSSQETMLCTHELYIADNSAINFDTSAPTRYVDESLWPDILVRRAQAILYSPARRMHGNIPEELTREGFCFENISENSMRTRVVTPDVTGAYHGDVFDRVASPILDQRFVNAIAEFAEAYDRKQRRAHTIPYDFPAFENWPVKEVQFTQFPKWW